MSLRRPEPTNTIPLRQFSQSDVCAAAGINFRLLHAPASASNEDARHSVRLGYRCRRGRGRCGGGVRTPRAVGATGSSAADYVRGYRVVGVSCAASLPRGASRGPCPSPRSRRSPSTIHRTHGPFSCTIRRPIHPASVAHPRRGPDRGGQSPHGISPSSAVLRARHGRSASTRRDGLSRLRAADLTMPRNGLGRRASLTLDLRH